MFKGHDQRPGTCEQAHAGLPAALKGGLVALGRQFGRGGEVDPVAGVDRRSAERDGQHGLAHPGRPDWAAPPSLIAVFTISLIAVGAGPGRTRRPALTALILVSGLSRSLAGW